MRQRLDDPVVVTLDEVEDALSCASTSLYMARCDNDSATTAKWLKALDDLLEWRALILSVRTAHAERGANR